MNEKLIEKKLTEAVKKLGGKALKLLSPFFTGFPDRTILLPGGRVMFVEVKTTGKTLSPRQKIVIPWLRSMGFAVYVIDSQEKLNDFIEDIQLL